MEFPTRSPMTKSTASMIIECSKLLFLTEQRMSARKIPARDAIPVIGRQVKHSPTIQRPKKPPSTETAIRYACKKGILLKRTSMEHSTYNRKKIKNTCQKVLMGKDKRNRALSSPAKSSLILIIVKISVRRLPSR